jgi:small-conductance mechanosensitive channel
MRAPGSKRAGSKRDTRHDISMREPLMGLAWSQRQQADRSAYSELNVPRAALDPFDVRLFTLGGADITLFTLLWSFTLAAVVLVVARMLRAWTVQRLLVHTELDIGARQAIGAIVRYLTLAVGFLAIVQTLGINLTTFNVLAGAVAVGVGFGLQNIFSNFVSGLILLLDRSIKVGDRIELANFEGEVVQIGARRTTVVTDDRIAILVPNQRFVTDNVVNRTYYGTPVRVRVPLAVQHGADPGVVKEIVLQCAAGHAHILPDPAPEVQLRGVTGNLQLELRVWVPSHLHRRDELVSDLNFAILDALRAHEIKPA